MKELLCRWGIILLILIPTSLLAQTRQITGRVTDEKGSPIAQATILLKGSSAGVSAGDDGRFTIAMPASGSRILVVSAVGFKTKEIRLSDSSSYQVVLQNAGNLDEVVVTAAFGFKQKKKTLGYNVQEVNSAELSKGRENSFINAIQGKVSGVNITSSGGTPGAGTDIVIRGLSSMNPAGDNQPLIVIDGVPVNNSTSSGGMVPSAGTNLLQAGSNDQFAYPNRGLDINPDDIESISVLKGAGATALYGLKAANGVLVITTKRGSTGKMSVGLNSSVSWDYLTKYPEIQTKYREGQQGRLSWNSDGTPNRFQTFGPPVTEGDPVYNNFKRAFSTGNRYNNSVTVQGGGNKTTYYSSFSALNQSGILPGTKFDRYTFKLAANSQLTEKFSMNGSATFTTSQNAQPSAGDKGVMTSLSYHTTTFDVRDYLNPDGSMKVYAPTIIDNPLYVAKYSQMNSNLFRMVGNLGFSWSVLPKLKLDYKIGGDYFNDSRTRIVPGPRYPGDRTTLDLAILSGGFIVEERISSRDVNSNAFLTWTDQINNDWDYSVMVGNNIQVTYNDIINNRGEKFGLVGFYDLSNTVNQYNLRTTTRRRYAGIFGNVKFGYKNAVYLELSGRNDWSSTLPVANNSFFYPAVSLSYIFTDLHNISNNVLNFGKLRVSYAQVGKDAPPYANGPYFSAPKGFPFVTGFNSLLGFLRSTELSDSALKPEMQKSFEVGTELHFLKDRLNLDVTYYNSRNVDQIIPVPISYTSGFATYYTNAGTIRNQGIEVELTAVPVKNKDWSWSITGNWSQNRSKVMSIKEGITDIPFYDEGRIMNKLSLGGSAGDLWGVAYRRDEHGNLMILPSGFPDVTQEFVKAGNAFPDWIGSLSTTLTWKNWSLSGLIEYKKGGDVFDVTMRNSIRNGVLKITENRYQQVIFKGVKIADGKENDIPVVLDHNYYRNTGLFNNIADVILQDASWLRLRNVSLSYTIPKKVLERTKFIRGASVGITGSNFILWTRYSGYDPGSGAFSTGYNAYGFTGSNIPNFSSWIFNLNLNF